MCYNIPTKMDFYRLEIEAFSRLLEATSKTFSTLEGYIMITQKRLKELLHYNELTGLFTRLAIPNAKGINSTHIGKIAGSTGTDGYVVIRLDKRPYKAHRLAWLYMYGEFPTGSIDHKDHDRANNRIKNLSAVTHSENMKNLKPRRAECFGVYKTKGNRNKSWKAVITVQDKEVFLGYHTTKHEAITARKKAEIKYGFHENHGRS